MRHNDIAQLRSAYVQCRKFKRHILLIKTIHLLPLNILKIDVLCCIEFCPRTIFNRKERVMNTNSTSGNELHEECLVGIHGTVEVAAIGINLETVCKKVAQVQKWSDRRTSGAEKKYREVLAEFALAFEGHGVVACPDKDVLFLWQVHCEEGAKYAMDMLTLAKAVGSFRGKSVDEKFPGPSD